MAKLEILNPVAQVRLVRSALAPRLSSLDGKRIALFWTGKPGGDIALKRVGQMLEGRYNDITLELIRSGTPGPKETVEYAATFDGVIGGFGD